MAHNTHLLGANKSMQSVLSYFIRHGEEVHLLTPNKKGIYIEAIKDGVSVHSFLFFYVTLYVKWNLKYLSIPILWLYNLLVSPLLLYKIWKINPDVIYCNSTSDAYSVWFAKILGKKHITHVREFGYEDFGASFIFGRNAKRKYLLMSDKLIFVSKAVAEKVIGEVPSCGKIIYDGLAKPKKQISEPYITKSLRIGVVGNIDISKRQDLAIMYMAEIIKKYPDMTLHIVGDKKCPYRNYIQDKVKELNLEKSVVFDGFVYDVECIYDKFDVLLMCSRSEAFGRVTIEAMLRNKLVIGYDSGGATELIEDGVTGFKFKNCDDVLKIINYMVGNPKKIVGIVARAKKVAEERYSEKRYVEDVYKFIVG